MTPPIAKAWWKERAVYQVWPASFCDSNGDGVGDIPGIISKLDHIKNLGAGIIWLSPIFKSPQVDMGYDISDYQDIAPEYGTLEDVDELLKEAHARDLKVIMDLVVNHSSDQHAWFQESRKSKDNDKADWYIWKDAKIGPNGERQPPNNWKSCFEGSTWEWVEARQQYYLHLFCPEQPDLNWENEDVRKAVYEMQNWWLDRGVDGFRMDVINLISKRDYDDAKIRDPNQEFQNFTDHVHNGPRVHEFLREMNEKVLKGRDVYTVGEIGGTDNVDDYLKYVRPDADGQPTELHTLYNFSLVDMDGHLSIPQSWDMTDFKRITMMYADAYLPAGAYPVNYLENHDQPRAIQRLAPDAKPEQRALVSKLLSMYLISQVGIPYVYMGEELAQINVPESFGLPEMLDVQSVNWYARLLKEKREREGKQDVDMSAEMKQWRFKSRDSARTPVQWTSGHEAGFTSGKPWSRVHDDYAQWNAETEAADPESPLHFWRKMLHLRAGSQILIYGGQTMHDRESNSKLMVLQRTLEGEGTILALLNFGKDPIKWIVPADVASDLSKGSVLVSNVEGASAVGEGGEVELAPFEGRLIQF